MSSREALPFPSPPPYLTVLRSGQAWVSSGGGEARAALPPARIELVHPHCLELTLVSSAIVLQLEKEYDKLNAHAKQLTATVQKVPALSLPTLLFIQDTASLFTQVGAGARNRCCCQAPLPCADGLSSGCQVVEERKALEVQLAQREKALSPLACSRQRWRHPGQRETAVAGKEGMVGREEDKATAW
eukprot:3574461-Rhodomonas_salina.4